jgi:hypothetical protein
MTRRKYKWRYTRAVFNGLVRDAQRKAQRNELLVEFSAAGPTAVYAALRHYAISRGWKRGSAFYAFKEIFSAPPRPQDERAEPAPLPNDPNELLVADWHRLRKKKPRRTGNSKE